MAQSTHRQTTYFHRLFFFIVSLLTILFSQKSVATTQPGSCPTLWEALERTYQEGQSTTPDTSGMDTYIAEKPTSEMLEMLMRVDEVRRPTIKSDHVRYLKRKGPNPDGHISIWELPDNTTIELSPNQIQAMPKQVQNWLRLSSP